MALGKRASIVTPELDRRLGQPSTVSHEGGYWRLPKRDVVSTLQVALQAGWLKIAAGLEHAETLKAELLNFRVKIDPKTAHDSYAHWRECEYDDLVLATAMACWKATQRPGARFAGPIRSY